MKKEIWQIIALFIIELMLLLPVSFAFNIYNVQATDITASSAKVSWQTDEYATGIVHYGKTEELGYKQRHTNYLFEHSLYLYGLEDETTYYFAIQSTDINGTTKIDNNSNNFYTFTTLDITPPEQVNGLTVESVGIDYVYIKWNSVDAADVSHYNIYRDRIKTANTTLTSFNDTSLIADRAYSYKVSAVDTSNNEGSLSDTVIATTLETDVTAPIITNVEVDEITDTSATIKWLTDENTTSVVYYGLNQTLDKVKEDNNLVLNHTVVITDLLKGNKYSYKVSSCDRNNNCVESGIEEFEAGADLTPPTINATIPEFYNQKRIDIIGNIEPYSKVRLYVNDMLSAIRALDREETADGKFEFYSIVLSQSNMIKIWAQDKAGNVNEKSYNLVVDLEDPVVNLEEIPSVVTEKNITIKGSVNEFVIINIYLISGEETVPEKITGLEAIAKNNSVELSWDESKEDDFSHYIVYREDVGAIAITKPASYNSYKDILVDNNEEYTYQVSAVNKFGKESLKSEPVTVLIPGGETGLPKPEEIVSIIEKKPTLSLNVSGSFSSSITLEEDGVYALKIEFIDKALNTVLVEKEITLDTKPPEIEIIRPSKGAFIYENYANEVDIEGTTEAGAEVHLYIERTPLGFLNKSFDVSGLPNEIQNLPESKLRADCRLAVGGTQFCSTGADFSTIADGNGYFKFENVDLTSWFGIGAMVAEIPVTEFTAEGIYEEETKTRLVFIATDKAGKRNALGIKYRIGTCWSGNFSWELTPLLQYQSPSVLSMERLRENNEQIFFYFNYTYVGRGKDGKIKEEQGGITVSKACSDLDVLRDPRFNISCQILPPGAAANILTKVNPEGKMSYTAVKLNRLPDMDKWLESDWQSFFEAVGNEITFPFKIRITYEHEVDGKTITEVQTTCQEVTYVLDNSLVDPRKVLPDWVLYDMVEFLNESIATINEIQEELRKVIDYVAVGCVASFLLRLIWQMYRRGVSIFDEKKLVVENILDIKFEAEKEEDKDYCKKVVKGIQETYKLKSPIGIKLKYFSDADLKKCFPTTWLAWEREAKLYNLYRLSCDRLFGHSTPSKWTEEATDDKLYTTSEKGTGCAVDESPFGQGVMTDKCRKFDKYPEAKTLELDANCVDVYTERHKTTLYKIGDKVEGSDKLHKLTVAAGFRAEESYAIKKTESSYLTKDYRSCRELCNLAEGEGKVFYDDTVFDENNADEYKNGYGCVRAKTCDDLRIKYAGEDKKVEITKAVRRGYSKDCFYDVDKPLAKGNVLGSVGVVSDELGLRYECCCIGAEKAPPSRYYSYDDKVRYVIEEGPEPQPAYAFESKKEEVKEPQGATEGEKWADMKWSYRYWKEKYETRSNDNARIIHYQYNPNRYIAGRDFPACFGQNSWMYDGAKLFGVDTKPGEGNLLIIDPAKQHISAFQCLHVTGIYNRLLLLKNMMSALSSCLITVRVSGRADTGVCKELFSQYICSVIWYVIQFWQEGCLPFGYGIDLTKSENKVVEYVSAGFKSIWGSVADSRSELMEEYGNAKLDNLLGTGEEAIARKICLAAFGYDWELGLEDVIDAAYASPQATLVQAITGTREYLTVDPDTQQATYEYRASWIINPGCDMRNYKVELSCISRNEIDKYGYGGGFGGINCEKVEDPAGHNCDCLELDKERLYSDFYNHPTKLAQGALENRDYPKIVTSNYRYDHLKFTLNPDTRISSELRERCFPDMHEDGVFYFPIRDKTIVDIAACYLDPSQGQFICKPPVEFWTEQGRAHFTDLNVIINGKKFKKDEEIIAFKGDRVEVEPTIRKLAGPPVCLIVDVTRGSVKDKTRYVTIDIDTEQNYPIPIEENVQITERGSISGRVTDCEPPTININNKDKTCKEILSGSIVKLKAIGTTNTKKEDITLEFEDKWSLSGEQNDKIDLSENSQDIMVVNNVRRPISQWWSKKYREIGAIIELEDKGIILKVEDVGYAKDIYSVKYIIEVPPVGIAAEQYWTIDLKLYQARDNSTDCSRYKEDLVEYAGKRQKETIRVKVKGQESEDPYKPKISIDVKGDLIPIEKNLPFIIGVTVSDDKGVGEIKYEIKKPDGKTLEDSERKGIKRMNCDDADTSNYKRKICEIKLTKEDLEEKYLNVGGDYKIIIKARDEDPEKKQKVYSEEEEKTFNVRCYAGNEYGFCQKEECGKDKKIESPTIGCIDEYKCCKIGQIE